MIRFHWYRPCRLVQRRHRRRGMLLIAVLVAMGIAVTLTGLMIRSGLRARHQMQIEWQLEQTRWLLDLGARSVLADPPDANRTIDLTEALPRYASGKLTIRRDSDSLSPTDASTIDSVSFRVIAVIKSRDGVPVVTRRSREVRVSGASDTR